MNAVKSIKDPTAKLAHPKYRPDIDGLRAIAVSAVIGFHAFPGIISGGFIGVDIFFVISGYLISTILFVNLEHDTFSIAAFYERRVRRIFPALIVVMLACAAFGWYVLLTNEYRQMGQQIAASSVFIQNFLLWSESGYFDSAAETKPLLHLWSLAIEEQFYIFWPVCLALMWKRKWNFLCITVTAAVISFIANIYASSSDHVADFYSPITRFWELMIGGILAYLALHKPKLLGQHRNAQSVFGLLCIVAGLIFIDKDQEFPGWWALLPTIGASFIISGGGGEESAAWFNRRILSCRLFVGLGLISYPLYLWHWPLLSFARIVRPHYGYKLKIILIGLALILAIITYNYIERQFRGRNPKLNVLAPLAAGMSVMCALGLLVGGSLIEPRLNTLKLTFKHEWSFLEATKADFDANDTGMFPLHQERKDITLFIGDSQLAQYAARVFRVQEQDVNSNGAIFAVGGGCIPIQNAYAYSVSFYKAYQSCWPNRDKGLKAAFDDKRVSKVVIGGSWNWYFFDDNFYYLDKDGKTSLASKSGMDKALASLESTILSLKKANKDVYLLLGNPVNWENNPRAYINRLTRADSSQINRYTPLQENQRELRARLIDLAKRSGASLIDPYLTICKEDLCERISEAGIPIFRDDSHFNPDWAIEHTGFIDISVAPVQKDPKKFGGR